MVGSILDPVSVGNKEEFAMHRAALTGDLERVSRLMEEGVSVGILDDHRRTPLHWAARGGSCEVVDLLCSLPECDLNVKDYRGRTPVLLAAIHSKRHIVDLLLRRGAQGSCKDDNSWTLLHYASGSSHGWKDVVQSLLNAGAEDLNVPTAWGDTPLLLAASGGHHDVAVLLVRAGADVNRIGSRNMTALHFAAQDGNTPLVQALLEIEGLDLNPQYKEGNTPLHIACKEGHRAVLDQLLAAGADTSIKNKNNETALSEGVGKQTEDKITEESTPGGHRNEEESDHIDDLTDLLNPAQGGPLVRAPFASKAMKKAATPRSTPPYKKSLDMLRNGKETEKEPSASALAAAAIRENYDLQKKLCEERRVREAEEHSKKMLLMDLQIRELRRKLNEE